MRLVTRATLPGINSFLTASTAASAAAAYAALLRAACVLLSPTSISRVIVRSLQVAMCSFPCHSVGVVAADRRTAAGGARLDRAPRPASTADRSRQTVCVD